VHELLTTAGHRLAAARDLTELQTIACDTALALLGADHRAGVAILDAGSKGFVAVRTEGVLAKAGALAIAPDALSPDDLRALSRGDAVSVAPGAGVLGPDRTGLPRGARFVLAPVMVLHQPSFLLAVTGTAVEEIRHPLAVLASMITLAQNSHEQGWVDAVIADARDIVLLLDPDGTVRSANAAVRHILGTDPKRLAGTPVVHLVHPEDAEPLRQWLARVGTLALPTLELRCAVESGDSWVDVEAVASAIQDGPTVRGVVLSLRDVRERNVIAAERTHRVSHDPLTNLANRAELSERIGHALSRAARTGVAPALLFIDLDDFKAVNDGLGREAGDRLLTIVAERLRRCLRPATRWPAWAATSSSPWWRTTPSPRPWRSGCWPRSRTWSRSGSPRWRCAPASASGPRTRPTTTSTSCCGTPGWRCRPPRRPAREPGDGSSRTCTSSSSSS
jgi:PAS domain S-box-containing protein